MARPEGGLREGWDKIYRTGDRARLLDDGSFVFLGRINGDTQVKLRGFRIELGEITSAIIKASEGVITDAVSIVRGTTDQMLVSFVVFERSVKEQLGQGTASIAYLRNLVQNLPLPIYMRPAIAIPLDRLPMTARGKLDTEALAAYELSEDVEEEEEEQLTETEEKLKNVWKAALPGNGLGIQIRKTSDFFSVGGNSLLLIRLRAAIGNAFGVGISLADLFHASTLESLAGRIDCRSPNSHQTQKIDWKAEMTLDATLPIAKTVRHLMPTPSEQPITVILTGSTGFLGREIVRHLIGHPLIARVHCVAVRQGRSLPASDKLVVHNGDLSARFLGLSEADAQDVFSTASAIIHNGAEVSHMKTYQTLRSTNVESTRQLIELALRTANDMGAPVPSFHFISSAGVGGLAIAPEFPEMSVVPYPPAAEEPNGYIAAKYVSECLLESASRRLGLPVTIHRPSNISGPGVQDRDIVHSIWRWSERMRAAPDLVAAGATGAFDFVGVNTCAAGIVAIP
ncbi:Nonribosomal peptide synthetase 14 [Escovopsis weberi]|uniref:Nonribosomal peptide synthetase 14 n=1 Tax=Escovopsis weberi TaxID=150374 RepID=A0A0M9VW11_ESCWE|nr:Nonribosomal peptide synthetase 14 [Escovopsis weberi]